MAARFPSMVTRLAISASLFLSIMTGIAQSGERLCIHTFPGDDVLASYDLPSDAIFALSFIHSVSLTPVLDTYRIENNVIMQTAETFVTHGQGLPSFLDERDATGWRHEDGKFILDMYRRIGTMIVRVQAEYQNILHMGGRDIPLAALGKPALRLAACATGDNE